MSILLALDPDWLIYSKPVLQIDASQSTVMHMKEVAGNQDVAQGWANFSHEGPDLKKLLSPWATC